MSGHAAVAWVLVVPLVVCVLIGLVSLCRYWLSGEPERRRVEQLRQEATQQIEEIAWRTEMTILDAALGYAEPQRSEYDNGNVIDAPWWEETS